MSLSDADLDRLEDTFRRVHSQHEALPLIAEVRALRARVVGGTDGPDQGDPAANPAVRWLVEKPTKGVVGNARTLGSYDDEDVAEDVARRFGATVVPLYRRAPGAVAAAPPGAEVTDAEVLAVARVLAGDRWVDDPEDFATSERGRNAYAQLAHDALVAARGASGPPAGHEDEAAVERADPVLGYYARLRAMEPSDELLVEIEAGELVRQRELAAARGPRPVENEAAVERAEEPVPVVTVCGPPVGCTCPAVAWTCICGAREARTSNPTEETR